MPSKSKSQQRLMGMVHAYQKGELKTGDMDKSLLNKIKKMSKQMKSKSVKDFAETKHDKLPQKVERKTINFKYFPILEYVDDGKEMDLSTFFDTIYDETDINILTYLLELIYSKKKYQNKIDKHFSDDKNMLKFPIELAKEDDDETLDYIDKLIVQRIKKLKDEPIENKKNKKSKEKRKYPTLRKMGFKSTGEEQEKISKQDVKTAYKRSGSLGYKFRHMESFSLFEAKNKKYPKIRKLN